MSDKDLLTPFMRGCKARASLPVGRSGGHTGEKQHGVVFLQYGEETKQVKMPAEISSQDSLCALFVTAFPHQLTMKMLQSPNVAIYIRDTSRNFYYELDDIRNISSHSCLKVYHKDPAYIFNRHTRPATTEGRISKEVLYGSHSPVHSRSSSGRSTLHSRQGSMSPPMVRSMPSSPSKKVYRGGSTERGAGDLGSTTLPRACLSGAGLLRSLCTNSSSSILERRDVKPGEDAGSTKSLALLRDDGGPHYQDSYCSSVQEAGGRLSVSSSQCSAPPSLASDLLGDSGGPGIEGSLKQYRASIKPLMYYGETMNQQTRSLPRQKNRKYGESQLPPLGIKTPPPSPQRASEIRMSEGQIIGGVGLVSAERMAPMFRSLRQGSNGTIETINRSRGNSSSSSISSVFVDSPLGTPERLFHGPVTPSTIQSERIKAMEEQIASLAGLVHHALSVGADIPEVKEVFSKHSGHTMLNNRLGVSSEHQNPAAWIDSFKAPPLALQAPPPDSELQQSLMSAQRNVCELRMQLNQLRHQQLLNQQSVRSMLHTAGQELLLLMCDRVSQCEETAFRRRAEMEEERLLYLRTEEAVLTQLGELEVYVDHLQRSSAPSTGQLSITLRDVEEAAVNLRRVGEALAVLKGEFPELQLKLRSVLRLEVEAVRFLKEEPLKMDAMLRRVRGLTEALSSLRRCVSESTTPVKPEEVPLKGVVQGPLITSPKPQPHSSVRPPLQAPPPAEISLDGTAFPILVRRMKSTSAAGVQPHHSPPLTPTHGRDSPTVAKVSPRSREGSPALQRRPGPGPGLDNSTVQSSLKLTHTQIETAHRQPPEGSQSKETTTSNQSSSRTETSTDSQEPSRGESGKERTPGQKPESERDMTKGTGGLALEQQQGVTANQQQNDTYSSHVTSVDTAPAASQPTSDTSLAPQSAPVGLERSRRPQLEKPRRSNVEKELKQSPDRAGRSPPPPPPPRRFQLAGSGLNTVRSAEEELTRREPVGAQGKGVKDKDPPVPPHSKPPRQPPEVKPKPLLSAPAAAPPAAAPPAVVSTHRDEKEKEEDNQVTKELQETTKLSNKNTLSGRNKGTGTPQGDNLSEPQIAAQLEGGPLSTPKLKDGHNEAVRDRKSPGQRKDVEKIIQLQSSLNSSTLEEEEKPPQHVQSIQNKEEVKTAINTGDTDINSPAAQPGVQKKEQTKTTNQDKAHVEDNYTSPSLLQESKSTPVLYSEQVCSPTKAEKTEIPLSVASADTQTIQKEEGLKTQSQQEAKTEDHIAPYSREGDSVPKWGGSPNTAEKKVKLTTIITLQKDSNQPGPEQTQEKALRERESPAEKKSNLMVVVTLQKESAEDCSEETPPQSQQEKSINSHQDCPASPPVLKRYPPLTDLTYRETTEMQDQEEAGHDSVYGSLYTEDGGSLSPDTCNDEGPPPPPPPPPTGKIRHRISKAKIRTLSKEEDLIRTSGSDAQTAAVVDTGEPEDCNDFDKKHVIVILNEPTDFPTVCKRLSTIFESEEDLDTILSPENLVYEEELQQLHGQETEVGKITISDINASLKHSTGKGKSSLPQRLAADHSLGPENQNQAQPGLPRKTETRKKFKFKFPKNKLAAISQAIRTGTKTGKKPLEVFDYEEEEETMADSRQAMETRKQTKECKGLEINSQKQFLPDECDKETRDLSPVQTRPLKSPRRVEELCKSTLDSIDSLEESIKLLEISVDSITAPSSPSYTVSSPPHSPQSPLNSSDRAQPKDKFKWERERSPSKRSASHVLKGPNPPQSKKVKAQPPPDTGKHSTKKQTSSSSAQRPHTKSRHSLSSGSERTPRNQPTNQKQSSQPRVVAMPR